MRMFFTQFRKKVLNEFYYIDGQKSFL